MKIKRIGKTSAQEIEFDNRTVLVSYSTPVAVNIHGEGFYRTEKKFSVTTSKQLNQWLDGITAKTVSQAELEKLAGM